MAKQIVSLILLVVLISASIATSLAWFATSGFVPDGGEVIPGYFARGSGTEEDPYIINRPIHLYNLAWLQNMGRFNQTYENGKLVQYHFRLEAPKDENGNPQPLDMSGYTLPPIGTTEYPFIGTFSTYDKDYPKNPRNPVTIANLTVSNIIDNGEVTKRPASVDDITGAEIVGMFGIIGQYNNVPEADSYTNVVPYVAFFYLDNPTIRTQTEKSLIGLVAGYVNGKLHEVGVHGGQIVSGANNTAGLGDNNDNLSIYGLIGDHHESVKWGGILSPDKYGSGGPLTIDANDPTTKTTIDDLSQDNNYFLEISGSSGRAYFVGQNLDTQSDGPKGYIYYNQRVTAGQFNGANPTVTISGSKQNYIKFSNYEQSLPSINSTFAVNEDLKTRLGAGGNLTIATGTVPPGYGTGDLKSVTIPKVSPDPINIPANGIWFRPDSPGDCIISFLVTQMNTTRYKSIYKYTRIKDANGNPTENIDPDSWKEVRLTFSKDILSSNNKHIVFYNVEVTQEDIDAGTEFVIGASSTGTSDDNVLFYFLALAGASDDGGTVNSSSKEIMEVNFINTLPYEEDSILGDDMKVTTFLVTLETAGKESYVTFSRDSMTVHASSSVSDDSIKSTKYEHQGIPPTIEEQNE